VATALGISLNTEKIQLMIQHTFI